jgi:cytoskeletal protein RodZ
MTNRLKHFFKQVGKSIYRKIRIRKAKNISEGERDICERYGEQVIGMMLAGGWQPGTKDLEDIYYSAAAKENAREWLTERSDYRERHDRWISFRDLLLEIVVILMIGWEIRLSLIGDRQQAESFRKQQEVLTNLQQSSKSTADTLAALKTTTETMSDTNARQLNAMQKSETQAERTAKASEEAAQTASKSMDFSQRAYVVGEIVLSAPPKAGEKLHLRARILNNGKTPALELTSRTGLAFVAMELPVKSAHDAAFPPLSKETLISKTTLGSGQQIEQLADSPSELTEADINGINAVRLRFYIFVYISYRDLFGHLRKTEVCQYYDPNSKLMMTCNTFNNAE